MAYIQISFTKLSRDTSEMLIALLAEMQYEGFEEQPQELKAFIPDELFDATLLESLSQSMQFEYSLRELPDTNWNAVWESNFKPVVIGNCALRASFHPPIENIEHEIIITPKMSFGTGHHPTTCMMIEQMQAMDFNDKRVLDFGTGTGVLAILAHKLGATEIVAIDNDIFSIENAAENFTINNIESIELVMAEDATAEGSFDIVLANITRNIIQDNLNLFNRQLVDDGKLLISGLLKEDEEKILALASNESFELNKRLENDNWISLLLTKTDAYLF